MSARDEIDPFPRNALDLLVQASRVSAPLRFALAEVEAYLNRLRNAERMDTYEHADGELVYGAISFMTEPEAFEENTYNERTEVLHKTWALVSVESLWFGPEAVNEEEV